MAGLNGSCREHFSARFSALIWKVSPFVVMGRKRSWAIWGQSWRSVGAEETVLPVADGIGLGWLSWSKGSWEIVVINTSILPPLHFSTYRIWHHHCWTVGGHCRLYLYLPEKGSSVCTSGLLKPCCLSWKFQSTLILYNASSSALKDLLFSTLSCLLGQQRKY